MTCRCRSIAMDAAAIELPEATLISEVSDEALEAAANTQGPGTRLFVQFLVLPFIVLLEIRANTP